MKITNILKTATKSLLSVGLLSTSLLAHADEFNLFSLSSAEETYSQQSPASDIVDTLGIKISTLVAFAKIQRAAIGDEIVIPVPSGEVYRIKIEGLTRHENGDISLAGSVNDEYRAMITHGKSGSYASIETPEGKYKIEIRSGKEWLLTPDDLKNLIPAQFKDDSIIPSLLELDLDLDLEKPIIDNQLFAAPSQEGIEDMATIDVMVLYTPELKEKRGGVDALESRINHLVTLSNKAYKDSEMAIAIRLVHSEEIAASNEDSIDTELVDLREGNGVFKDVLALRESKGADLVVLMRDYVPKHDNCGLANILGDEVNGMVKGYRKYGYGIVHDGSTPGGSFCSDYTFTHELGHNFGFKHDRDNANGGGGGVFDYAYGHDEEDKFATIMSYNSPQIGMFSNPDIFCSLVGTCNGDEPLGIAEGEEHSANNAKAGNNVRFDIANFYEAVNITYKPGDETGNGEVDVSDVVAIINLVLSESKALKGGDCTGEGEMDVKDIVCAINLVLSKK